MDLKLKDKVALVTGSSSGIGLAIARALDEESSSVILNSRNENHLKKAQAGLPKALAITADVRELSECRRLVSEVLEAYGRLDILICNVGSGKSVPPGKETPKEESCLM